MSTQKQHSSPNEDIKVHCVTFFDYSVANKTKHAPIDQLHTEKYKFR